MTAKSKTKKRLPKVKKPSGGRRVASRGLHRGKYDAAQTNADNARHWQNADILCADDANSPGVRQRLRIRSRYEVENNSYAKGIVNTLAEDCIGTGPRLQMLSGSDKDRRLLEKRFNEWAEAVNLADKLKTMRKAKATDGESFAYPINNQQIYDKVKLDLFIPESDRIANPYHRSTSDPNDIDGIILDHNHVPVRYLVLKKHPGSIYGYDFDVQPITAACMIHWYRQDRPEQHRGVPELTSALELFAQLRRYTLATLAAAETAAEIASVLQTAQPPNEEDELPEPLDQVELERRVATVLPDGYSLSQVKAEQPTTTYSEFEKCILIQVGRCLNMPYNKVAGNSSGYNYASGRLDHQTYDKSILNEQNQCVRVVLSQVFRWWIQEAILIEGYLPQTYRRTDAELKHQWFFDGPQPADPVKEASAQKIKLSSGMATKAAEYAKDGKDYEAEIRQDHSEKCLEEELKIERLALRKKLMEKHGLTECAEMEKENA